MYSLTPVEKYLNSKGIRYHLEGRNAIIPCIKCGQDEGQFGINIDNWFWNCFRGKCAAKGNEITFKRHFGDSAQAVSNLEEDVVAAGPATNSTKPEPVPTVEALEKAHQKLMENDEVLNWLNDERGLSIETVKAAKLGLGLRRFGPKGTPASQALMFPYFNGEQCVGVKYRTLPPEEKDFRFTAGHEVGIYRQSVIKKDMDALILCEGESDTLALVNQGVDNAVGLPGCDTLKNKEATWGDKLNLPKKLYLVFDNDEAGQKGAHEFATRFGIGKFHNVIIPKLELDEPIDGRTTIKDVNEFFAVGHTLEEFNQLLEHAKPFDIEGVTTMDSAFNELIDYLDKGGTLGPKYSFKWDSVNQRAKGIDDGDLVIVLAPAKTGKTTFCLNQTEFMAQTYGMNPHFDCMEMSAGQLLKKWAAMVLAKDEDSLTAADIREAQAIAKSRSNQFVFTRSNPGNLDKYLDFLRKIKQRYDTGVIVIDNLQLLVDLTLGSNGNRPAYISTVCKRLKALAGELGVPIILIAQPRGVEEGTMVTSSHSEGSRAPSNDCDLFLVMNRNPEIRMKLSEADSIGKLETNQSHSDKVFIEVALSRRSAGGLCTLKIEGSKSILREYTDDERKANTKQVVGDLQFVDESKPVEI